MADMFVDKTLVNALIRKTCDNPEKYLSSDKAIWFSLTRLMFKNFPTIEVYSLVEKASEEASDEQWFEHKYPKGSFKETWVYPKRKSVIKLNLKNARIRKQINDNLKITDVAESYGLIIKKEKALCPFHNDTEPSLSFSNEKNVFNCFGCGAKGDIISFIKKMENKKENDNNKKGS